MTWFPISTDGEARALLHGAGASIGERDLQVVVPDSTPVVDVVRAAQRLGFVLTKSGKQGDGKLVLVMKKED